MFDTRILACLYKNSSELLHSVLLRVRLSLGADGALPKRMLERAAFWLAIADAGFRIALRGPWLPR